MNSDIKDNDKKIPPVIIKDNDKKISPDEFDTVSNLKEKILDKTLEELEETGIFVFPPLIKDTRGMTKNEMIIKHGYKKKIGDVIQTGNIMGVLGYEDETLIITSRFASKTDDASKPNDAPKIDDHFFNYMLERVLHLPALVDLKSNISLHDQIFDYLAFMFPYYLKQALRKGLYKKYVTNKYNDSNVKGPIDIARHIKENTPFTGRIAYNKREFSYDNYVMELIRHTIEFIGKKKKNGSPYGKRIIQSIKDEVRQIVDATPGYRYQDRQKVIIKNIQNPVRHMYYHEYRDIQRLCIEILQNKLTNTGSDNHKVYGILFDGAWLWEEYIYKIVQGDFHHPRNKEGKETQYLFKDENDKDVGKIYPDFIGKENSVIADAKYKPVENIGNEDYRQILAYMYRFDSKKSFFFYPYSKKEENKSDKILILRLNQGNTWDKNVKAREDITVTKLGLEIPLEAKDYDDFKKKIKASEESFKDNY